MTLEIIRVATVVAVAASSTAALVAQRSTSAHTHIEHVATRFADTPESSGLLPTAMAEARIVAQHAALAAQSTADTEALKRHVGHVLHAIDPTLNARQGPGLGYGLKKAVAAATHHLELAGRDTEASENVKTHVPHIVASTTNTTKRADEIVDLAQRLQNSSSATEVASLVRQLSAVAAALIPGVDVNGDGRVGWELGEGGLQQAQAHLELMKQGAR